MRSLTWFVLAALSGVVHAGTDPLVNGGFEKVVVPGRPLFHDPFDSSPRYGPFRRTWGDQAEVEANTVETAGPDRGGVARLRLRWTERPKGMTPILTGVKDGYGTRGKWQG